jgi:hypothetical protein
MGQYAAAVAYSDAHNRAADSIQQRYLNSAKDFAEVIAAECFLTDAFLTPAKTREKLSYTLDPNGVERAVQLQTQAAIGLHRIWKDFAAGKAQTGEERAIGAYMAAIITDAVDSEAAQDAEARVEDLGRRGKL